MLIDNERFFFSSRDCESRTSRCIFCQNYSGFYSTTFSEIVSVDHFFALSFLFFFIFYFFEITSFPLLFAYICVVQYEF